MTDFSIEKVSLDKKVPPNTTIHPTVTIGNYEVLPPNPLEAEVCYPMPASAGHRGKLKVFINNTLKKTIDFCVQTAVVPTIPSETDVDIAIGTGERDFRIRFEVWDWSEQNLQDARGPFKVSVVRGAGGAHSCPEGYVYDPDSGECVPKEQQQNTVCLPLVGCYNQNTVLFAAGALGVILLSARE